MPATAERPKATKTAKKKVATPPFGFGGSIEIPAGCKPSKAVSKDRIRPILCHAFVKAYDGAMWVCASDSYQATAIKVSDVPMREGFIPVGALRLMERGQRAEQISYTAWKVWTNEGTVTFDVVEDLKGAVKFPKLEDLGLWEPKKPARPEQEFNPDKPRVALNQDLLAKVAAAIGGTAHGIELQFAGPLAPIRVLPLASAGVAGERVGLVMPIRLNV